MRAIPAVMIVLGLCLSYAGCQHKGPRSYQCKASFAPRPTVLTFQYEHVATPEDARDKCMADAKQNMPNGTREIGCECVAK